MTGALNAGQIVFAPLVPWALVGAAAAVMLLVVAVALWRGLKGWWLRALAAMVLVAALANPSYQREERQPLSDIVLLIVDESSSQQIADRPQQTRAAVARVEAAVKALPNTELRVSTVGDGKGDEGTRLMTALAQAMAEEPRARIAGAIMVSDGQLHDLDAAPPLPAPLHLLLTGHATDWDRRLVVKSAPAFAIMGEPVTLTVAVEDQGAVPDALATGTAPMAVSVDGGPAQTFRMPIGQDVQLPLTLPHGGMNVVQLQVATSEGELTDRNNAAVLQINGVRDRLRVLLVSGEPNAGERTWRNLLKSDSSVDLVHFTILRPPEKQDGVPVSELSLIAFPTRELFLDKIDQFDLIIFDRYRLRGILPSIYLDNVRDYVEKGGAVLVSAGPEYASVDSLYRSPLGAVLPAAPTGRVIEQPFLPKLTEIGQRHPVTEGLTAFAPRPPGPDGPGWGRWFRRIEVTPTAGETLMSGDGKPLLQLARVGKGRVALLASDQAWLWSRGYEGGGPQLELLRRLAHWEMKEPELEEESLSATADGQDMTITRRTLGDGARQVTVTGPDGKVQVVPMKEASPGRWVAQMHGPQLGLYKLKQGGQSAVIALGPSAPKEFEETIASGDKLQPLIDGTRGGVVTLEDGFPSLRRVSEGRPAAGRGWIGITPRDAYLTADVTITPLMRGWLALLLAALLIVGAWLLEGRRSRGAA